MEAREHLAQAGRTVTWFQKQLAELQQQQAERRLSVHEKKTLIAALAPYRGQKVRLTGIFGDADGKAYIEDLVAVLDAAGWDHDGAEGVTFHNWDRDPVGIEVTLNEADARAGRLSNGIGALINVVRRLGLTSGNTIVMNADVPAGQVMLRVGKKFYWVVSGRENGRGTKFPYNENSFLS